MSADSIWGAKKAHHYTSFNDLDGNPASADLQGMGDWNAIEGDAGRLFYKRGVPRDRYILELVVDASLQDLERQNIPELGRGFRGVAFDLGGLVVKKFTSHKQDAISGLSAANANSLLTTALINSPDSIGGYALRGCMPRAVYMPDSLVEQPTWVMDRVPGESAQDMLRPPLEATEMFAGSRDDICALALACVGVPPGVVFLDTTCGNVVVDETDKTLYVIDAMGASPMVTE